MLDRNRIQIVGCIQYRYAIPKLFEYVASGCLIVSNRRSDAYLLGFEAGSSYIEINEETWKEKTRYYIGNPEDIEKTAKRGCRLTKNFNNHDISAEQFNDVVEHESKESNII